MSEAAFSYNSEGVQDGVVVMKLVGPLTMRNLFAFHGELASNKPPLMIFDLSEVPYIDSAGIGVLIGYYIAAKNSGRRMALAGANERIQALLVRTRVRDLLQSFVTVEEAIAK